MLGTKFTNKHFNHILRNVKSHVRSGYHHTKSFLNHFDRGISTAKQIYSVIEPLIKEVAGHHQHKQIHNHVMTGLSNYEKIKKQVIDGHEEMNHVGKKLMHLGI